MHSLCSVGAKLRVCTVNIPKQYVSYFPAPGSTVNWRDTDFTKAVSLTLKPCRYIL